MKRWYLKYCTPKWIATDLRQVNWPLLAARGIRVVLLDIDNTLVRHGSHEGDDYAREVVAGIQAAGLECWILSNAVEHRAQRFAESMQLPYLGQARKPSGKRIRELLTRLELTPEQVVLVGDQLLTDVWAGKAAGTHVLLARPLDRQEAWNVRLKRYIERFMVWRWDGQSGLEDICLPGDGQDGES